MNENKFITLKEAYELDMIGGYPALTEKNALFIKSVINIDTRYAKYLKDENGNEDFIGAPFKSMKNGKNFEQNLEEAIKIINKSNHTHLLVCENGIEKMKNLICSKCKNYNDLVNELNQDIDKNKDHLFRKMLTALKTKNGQRINLSFVSKFCVYATKYLNLKGNYHKYDKVVASNLPSYVEIYLNKKINKNAFLTKNIDTYLKYSKYIDEIVEKLNNNNINISSEDIDNIIWYTNK